MVCTGVDVFCEAIWLVTVGGVMTMSEARFATGELPATVVEDPPPPPPVQADSPIDTATSTAI